jgi:nucleotide-binding universal stress UspA family protein
VSTVAARPAQSRRAQRPEAAARSRAVLLASEGRPFSAEAVRVAADLAREHGGEVRVLAIARMWGTSLGFPHPGLRPSRREIEEHQRNVADAIEALERLGVGADGHIITTRRATRSILAEARRTGSREIVMGADRPRSRLLADFMWSQEPYRVRRRARVPVRVAESPTPSPPASRVRAARSGGSSR